MTTITNRSKAAKFRELIKLLLRSEGVHLSERHGAYRLSERLAETYPQSHLLGAPSWAIQTRSDRQIDLSGSVDRARAAADHDHKRFAVSIQFRASRPAEESYVVMTLSDFTEILKSDIERNAS